MTLLEIRDQLEVRPCWLINSRYASSWCTRTLHRGQRRRGNGWLFANRCSGLIGADDLLNLRIGQAAKRRHNGECDRSSPFCFHAVFWVGSIVLVEPLQTRWLQERNGERVPCSYHLLCRSPVQDTGVFVHHEPVWERRSDDELDQRIWCVTQTNSVKQSRMPTWAPRRQHLRHAGEREARMGLHGDPVVVRTAWWRNGRSIPRTQRAGQPAEEEPQDFRVAGVPRCI
mmetsp:Transcript_165582/g.402384  ORF Transcript_165582/g.402384 Transcript_165582/m.402384 type:complete len:228 (-) Transcript_165582:169-852(-)